MKHRTEQVYDDEMFPLVAQLIAIAKREGIPLLVSAVMLDEAGKRMSCDTKIPGPDDPFKGSNNRHALAVELIRGHSGLDNAAGLVISRYHE